MFKQIFDPASDLADGVMAMPVESPFLFSMVVVLLAVAIRSTRISKEKTTRLRLKNEELDAYRTAMEAHAMVSVCACDGAITYVNDTLAQSTGFSLEYLNGRKITELLSFEADGGTNDAAAPLRSGKTWQGETKIRKQDGGYLWARTTIVPVIGKSGTVSRTISLHTDITESKVMQAELWDRAMIDRIRDEVYIFTLDTLELVYLNKSSLEAANWVSADVAGKRFSDVCDSFDEAAFRDRVAPLLDGKVETILYETTDQERTIETGLQIEQGIDGTKRFVAVVRDVSERKRAERDKSEFVSTVSHELRSPLTSIKGSLNLIASGAVGQMPERASPLVDVAIRNVDRLVRLINDLLDLEKLDANMMDLTFEPIDLVSFADEAIAANAGYGHEYGVRMRRVGSSAPIYANVSRDGMMQVLTNLLSNAVKFSPRGQCVEIEVKEDFQGVRLTVTDRGNGISPEAQSKLFTRFAQAHKQLDQRHGGTGLGLSIAKSIIEKLDGEIGFASEIGKGTTFFVTLPSISNLATLAHHGAASHGLGEIGRLN